MTVLEIGKKTDNKPIGVLLHGFGASANNIAPLCYEFLDYIPYWVVPQAPVSLLPVLGDDGYAWFPKDSHNIQQAIEGEFWRSVEDIDTPDIAEASKMLYDFLCNHNICTQEFVIAGFSQGGMVASDLTLLLAQEIMMQKTVTMPLSTLLFSSSLISLSRWNTILESLDTSLLPPVFVSHAYDDAVLDYDKGKNLYDWWNTHTKNKTQLYSFNGGHDIPSDVCKNAMRFITEA